MKKIFLFLTAALSATAVFAQQNTPISAQYKAVKKANTALAHIAVPKGLSKSDSSNYTDSAAKAITAAPDTSIWRPSRFVIYGIGDLSSQTLSQVNAAGKISFFAKPWSVPIMKRNRYVDADGKRKLEKKNGKVQHHQTNKEFMTSVFASFNLNANNTDSNIEKTILFADIGKAPIILTPEIGIFVHTPDTINNHGWSYYYGLMAEFSNKQINASKKKDGSDTSVYFNVNSITLGIKGACYYQPDDKNMISFTALAYFNHVHIPDKDSLDFKYILGQRNLVTNFNSVGGKLTLGINDFQIYADVRHVFYDYAGAIPDRQLASTSVNVGLIIPLALKKMP